MKYKIEMGGEERSLDFSMETLALYWESAGIKLTDLASMDYINLSYKGMCELAAVSLQEGGNKLPEDFNWRTVSKWFTEDKNANVFLEKFYHSQGLVITDEEKEEAGKLLA